MQFMKLNYFVLICGLLSLIGCTTIPKQVNIPVIVKQPSPKIPLKPNLPIASLTKQSKPNEVMKAYVESVEILQGYSDQLIQLLKAYK